MRRKEETQNILLVILSTFLVFLGIYHVVLAFQFARENLVEEHNQHLLDIAWSTDRNVAVFLGQSQIELSSALERVGAAEHDFMLSKQPDALMRQISNIALLKDGYFSAILITADTSVLLSTNPEYGYDFRFPLGLDAERLCLCTGGSGENYLAVVSDSPFTGLHYVALIDLTSFYRFIAGNELSDEYWLVLYHSAADLFLQNDADEPELSFLNLEQALARRDGYSILAQSEKSGSLQTVQYSFSGSDPSMDVLLAAIPTNRNMNRVFAVGVGVESTSFMGLLSSTFQRIAICGAMILSGLLVMIALLLRNRRRNTEIREQAELLRSQNEFMEQLLENTKELAHHQRLETIGIMTSGIAHEFNNLLTPIMGYSILCMEKLPESCSGEIIDNLEEIYDASRRAKILISRLSALSRKSNGAALQRFSPDEMLVKVREMAVPSMTGNVRVIEDFRCPEKCLYANETEIVQVILNLIINAFHAMKQLGGTVTVSSFREGELVYLRVADTGPGIPQDQLSRIFEPFYTTKETGKGTGLGLAIARQLIDIHKGSISVESELGVGTVFTVTLPASVEPEEAAEENGAAPSPDRAE